MTTPDDPFAALDPGETVTLIAVPSPLWQETGGGVGAVHLIGAGFRPDFCNVTEAGDLDVGVISAGYVQGRIRITGEFKARVPYANPIEAAARLIAAFGPSNLPLPSLSEGGWIRFIPHPLLPGFPRMSVRGIKHFQDTTTLMFDLRKLPGMTEASLTIDLRTFLDRMTADAPSFRFIPTCPMVDERIEIAQIRTATRVLALAAARLATLIPRLPSKRLRPCKTSSATAR